MSAKDRARKGVLDEVVRGKRTLLRFVDALNAKFAKPPRHKKDAHRRLPRRLDLRDVFCIDEERSVSNYWCIRHENVHYQIAKLNAPLPRPGEKVTVRRWLDGSLHLLYRNLALVFAAIEAPLPGRSQHAKNRRAALQTTRTKPADNHPWRKRPWPPKTPRGKPRMSLSL